MAIAEDGQWFGYLSGGCAEQAIADEGVKAIKQNQSHSMRYGLGSPYLDIQLPCGAGIDVWFDQQVSQKLISEILAMQALRQRIGLQCQLDGGEPRLANATDGSILEQNSFRRYYLPKRQLTIIGAGPNVSALSKLAQDADYQTLIFTPDAQTLNELSNQGQAAELLNSQAQIDGINFDAYSAAVLMFHEHARETRILQRLLKSDAAYIGALGSQRTHLARTEGLLAQGFSKLQCDRIHGPIGLNIHAKTPSEIAISVLAQLTFEFQSKARPLLYFNGPVGPS